MVSGSVAREKARWVPFYPTQRGLSALSLLNYHVPVQSSFERIGFGLVTHAMLLGSSGRTGSDPWEGLTEIFGKGYTCHATRTLEEARPGSQGGVIHVGLT